MYMESLLIYNISNYIRLFRVWVNAALGLFQSSSKEIPIVGSSLLLTGSYVIVIINLKIFFFSRFIGCFVFDNYLNIVGAAIYELVCLYGLLVVFSDLSLMLM